jgi:hypothetical protein
LAGPEKRDLEEEVERERKTWREGERAIDRYLERGRER